MRYFVEVEVRFSHRELKVILTESAVNMTSPDPQKTPTHFGETTSNPGTPSELLDGSNGGLHIPVSGDSGFYGYNEEKHLQHVSISTPSSSLPLCQPESSAQMGEKLFVQRRASTNSDGGKAVFKSSLAMTSVAPVIEPNILSMSPSPFTKEDELKEEAGTGPHPAPGTSSNGSRSNNGR